MIFKAMIRLLNKGVKLPKILRSLAEVLLECQCKISIVLPSFLNLLAVQMEIEVVFLL